MIPFGYADWRFTFQLFDGSRPELHVPIAEAGLLVVGDEGHLGWQGMTGLALSMVSSKVLNPESGIESANPVAGGSSPHPMAGLVGFRQHPQIRTCGRWLDELNHRC